MKHNPPSKAKVQAWRISHPTPETVEPEPAPAPEPSNDPLHGYTLEAIDHLTRYAIRLDRWYYAGDIDERFDAVRHAIVERLLTSTHTPDRHDLIQTGLRASTSNIATEARVHGRDVNRVRPVLGFYKYWEPTHRGASPESHVVDRHALTQIWPLLLPREQAALTALAATDDYRLAAESLGIPAGTMNAHLHAARKRFLALWHEGETPSRLWRNDKRVDRRDGRDHHGRPRLTAAQVDSYRQRKLEGETLTSLAAEAGVSLPTLSRLVSGKRKAPEVVA